MVMGETSNPDGGVGVAFSGESGGVDNLEKSSLFSYLNAQVRRTNRSPIFTIFRTRTQPQQRLKLVLGLMVRNRDQERDKGAGLGGAALGNNGGMAPGSEPESNAENDQCRCDNGQIDGVPSQQALQCAG